MTEIIVYLAIPAFFGSLDGWHVAFKKGKIIVELFKDSALFLAALIAINIAIPLKEITPFMAKCFFTVVITAMVAYVIFFLSAIIAWLLTIKINPLKIKIQESRKGRR